jgi:two-component system, sensor histidine kinase and response regulator
MASKYSAIASGAPSILVVDDQPQNVRVVGQLLAQVGYEIIPVLSGAEAIARASDDPPDLVLLDMLMPGMSGVEVLSALQKIPAVEDVPVIFLTADIERDSLTRAFGAGAVDYITKPFVPEELLVRVRTHIELKQSRDALRKIAAEKQQVAETVAHDLRNYFANIMFAAEVLRDSGADEEQKKRLIDSILTSSDSGLLFLQSFLEDQSALAQGNLAEPLPALDLLQHAVDLLSRQAQIKAIRVQIEATETLTLLGHRAAATHVLQNLLSNALKYSPANTDVLLTASKLGTRGRVCVMDRGPGISKIDQTHLFERYVRLSAQPTQGESSTGLGLALARQRARTIGGDIWYEDRDGGGAAFTFELPLA